jgi:hypothetical protein
MSTLEKLAENLSVSIREYTDFIEQLDYRDPANLLFVTDNLLPEHIVECPIDAVRVAREMLNSVSVQGRHNRDERRRLHEAVRNAAASLDHILRYGVSEHLLSQRQVDYIRESPRAAIEYGRLERGVTGRVAICRSCAQRMPKGTSVLKFFWDFKGEGSWTATAVAIHDFNCPNKMESVEDP